MDNHFVGIEDHLEKIDRQIEQIKPAQERITALETRVQSIAMPPRRATSSGSLIIVSSRLVNLCWLHITINNFDCSIADNEFRLVLDIRNTLV